MKRHRVAAVTDIPMGEGREFVVGEKLVAVFNADGQFFAMDGICPHAGGPLARGSIHGNVVTCPWHGWQFDIATGRHCLNPHLQHPAYAVSIDGHDLWVELP